MREPPNTLFVGGPNMAELANIPRLPYGWDVPVKGGRLRYRPTGIRIRVFWFEVEVYCPLSYITPTPELIRDIVAMRYGNQALE